MQGTRYINKELSESLYHLQQLLMDQSMHELFVYITEACRDVLKNGGKLIFAGNGVSAATAQQCALMTSHKIQARRAGLAAITLASDGATLTGVASSEGFDKVFSRQIESLGNPGDMLIVFSPTADEENILEALDAAKRKNMICVGMTGQDGKSMLSLCDALIHVPSGSLPRICEAHTVLATVLATLTETLYFNESELSDTDESPLENNVFGFKEAKESKENW